MKLTWKTFLQIINIHPELNLRFEYGDKILIASDYHITEFKLANIQSIDCGGNIDSWSEMILQVLEPGVNFEKEAMEIQKLLSIIDKVNSKMDIPNDCLLRIEFGNKDIPMSQYFVNSIGITNSSLIVHLEEGAPECKAAESCGLPNEKASKDNSKSACGCGPSISMKTPTTEISKKSSGCC
ncbi:MAG: DUF6428 family protein [Leptospira sp.]|nr:DUF6428 family protein [Leptospira sp.]